MITLTVLGGSPAWPNPGQAASGYLVESGDSRLLLDCGTGVAGVLRQDDPGPLTDIVISHFHADHWFDLVPLHFIYLYGAWKDRARPRLYLPPDGRAKIGLVATAWEGSISSFERAFEIEEYDPAVPRSIGQLHVRFVATRHYCTCYAMRIEGADGVIAYTADTAPDPDVEQLVRGADVLVCEASLGEAADDNEGDRGHMAPDEAGTLAAAAGVRRLLLTHVPIERGFDRALERSRSVYDGPVDVARPGLRYTLG